MLHDRFVCQRLRVNGLCVNGSCVNGLCVNGLCVNAVSHQTAQGLLAIPLQSEREYAVRGSTGVHLIRGDMVCVRCCITLAHAAV